MVVLHRLGHREAPFHLNADLIQTVEARPDTVVSLTTGVNLVVAETPAEVVAAVLRWRRQIAAGALLATPAPPSVQPAGPRLVAADPPE